MKMKLSAFPLILLIGFFTACSKDDVPVQDDAELPLPTISNVEVGLNNNELGLLGRDFHFNVDIVAGDKIEDVQIKIVQRTDESYTKKWDYERKWDQHKGAKNTNVHTHFDIPMDAAEGVYDFLIIVQDQNGTKLEEKRKLTIKDPANRAVDPKVTDFVFGYVTGDLVYSLSQGGYYNPDTESFGSANTQVLRKGNEIRASIRIADVKDDGIMYVIMVNKKHNHRPESIKNIDFSKAIVLDVYEHKGTATIGRFFNYTSRREKMPHLIIGASEDNSYPAPRAIEGAKTWESGNYSVGVIYENTTHNVGVFKYIDVSVDVQQ